MCVLSLLVQMREVKWRIDGPGSGVPSHWVSVRSPSNELSFQRPSQFIFPYWFWNGINLKYWSIAANAVVYLMPYSATSSELQVQKVTFKHPKMIFRSKIWEYGSIHQPIRISLKVNNQISFIKTLFILYQYDFKQKKKKKPYWCTPHLSNWLIDTLDHCKKMMSHFVVLSLESGLLNQASLEARWTASVKLRWLPM